MKARSLLQLVDVVVVVAVALGGCGSSSNPDTPDAPGVDTEPPHIVSSSPTEGEMKASILASFSFSFSESLDPATVTDATVSVLHRDDDSFPRIAGTVSYDDVTHTVTFKPLAPLRYDSLYLVTLGAIKDPSGNAFAGATLPFHTFINGVTREVTYASNGQVQSWNGNALDANGHEAMQLTYTTPGNNTTWLDNDDVATQRYDFEYAGDGRFINYYQVSAGNDLVAGTSDDKITVHDRYTYDAMLRRTSIAKFTGPGGDMTWGNTDDLQGDHAEYVWSGYAITSHAYFDSAGSDGIWNNDNDTGPFWRQVEHDAQYNITRSTYILTGGDGLPMTTDDVIQNTTAFEFDATFSNTRTILYDGAGNDLMWATGDDHVASYTKNDLDADGQILVRMSYSGYGSDQTWFTGDDTASSRQVRTYGANKLLVMRDSYSSYGGDMTWGTSDDVLASYTVVTYDANGNRVREKLYTGAGGDGNWHTGDDVLAIEREFDTAH